MLARLPLMILITVLVSGCGNAITEAINKRFPPVSINDQRREAINLNADSLTRMPSPNIGIGVSLEDVHTAVYTEDLKKDGVAKIEIRGEEQLLKLHVEFDRAFTKQDAGKDEKLGAVLDAIKPRVAGKITFYAGVGSRLVDGTDSTTVLEFQLLPYLQNLEVTGLQLADKVDMQIVPDAIVSMLTKYKDNLIGEFSRSQFSRIKIPMLSKTPVDLNQLFRVNGSGATGQIEIVAKRFTAPYDLDAVAVLVQKNHVAALVQLRLASFTGTAKRVPVKRTFEGIVDRFDEIADSVLNVPEWDSTNWVAVNKETIATAVNGITAQANLCINAAVSVPEQKLGTKVKLPNGLGINCSSTRQCPDRRCSFDANRDTRDCNTCMIRVPRVCAFGGCVGGQCTQRWNEPTCEAAKAAQNAIYDTDANLRKLDCDRLRNMEILGCEAEKFAEKGLCEAKKEALNRLAATGNFANVDFTSKLATDNMRVCLKDFRISSEIDRVQFALDVQGDAKVDVGVKFVPLDIAGHIACPVKWDLNESFNAKLSDPRVAIDAKTQIKSDDQGARADFSIEKIKIKAKLSPGPTEVLLKNPKLLVTCPVMQMIAPVTVVLTPFVPELRGEIEHEIDAHTASFFLPLPVQTVGAQRMSISVKNEQTTLVAIAKAVKP